MIQVITRRWPPADIVIVPVRVQGEGAAEDISKALGFVHRLPGVDVVITGRGGGSLEDLWCFNTELVARAIAACKVPVISAVGHEIDVSIADLVADRRRSRRVRLANWSCLPPTSCGSRSGNPRSDCGALC
jgi:exodeoxyribonuclease VII large subunit